MKKVNFGNNLSDKDNSGKDSLEHCSKMSYKVKNIDVEKVDIDSPPPPWPRPGVIRIVSISDTHNKHRKLTMPPGDILIHSGDFTNRGYLSAIREFDSWLGELPYQDKIVVAGNHDTAMDPNMWANNPNINDLKEANHVDAREIIKNAKVLVNETVEVRGIKIFGSPYTLDPFKLDWWAYKADNETQMEALVEMPSNCVDIVVTHSPPFGVGDLTSNGTPAGSKAVLNKVVACNPALHVFGHIHEAAGAYAHVKGTGHSGQDQIKTTFVNGSSIPWTLKPIGPLLIDISEKTKEVLNVSRSPQVESGTFSLEPKEKNVSDLFNF